MTFVPTPYPLLPFRFLESSMPSCMPVNPPPLQALKETVWDLALREGPPWPGAVCVTLVVLGPHVLLQITYLRGAEL